MSVGEKAGALMTAAAAVAAAGSNMPDIKSVAKPEDAWPHHMQSASQWPPMASMAQGSAAIKSVKT